MALPDKPNTRKEMYLNAAATGDTSRIPSQPYTREEMYLDAIAKNGGGSGSSSGGVLVVNVATSNVDGNTVYTCDKTAGEMYQAAQNGVVILRQFRELGDCLVVYLRIYGHDNKVGYFFEAGGIDIIAAAATDYPSGIVENNILDAV